MKEHTLIGMQLFADPKSDFEEAAAQVALTTTSAGTARAIPATLTQRPAGHLAGVEPEAKREGEFPYSGA